MEFEKMKNSSLKAAVVASALGGSLLFAGTARATIIASDGMRTTDGYANSGTTVQSQSTLNTNGGFAAGAWNGASTGFTYESTSLSFGSVVSGGGSVQHTSSSDATRTVNRTISPAYPIPATNVDHYASFLLNLSAVDTSGYVMAGFLTGSNSGKGLAAGVSNGNLAIEGRNGTTDTRVDLGTAYAANTNYLFVIKLGSGGDSYAGTDPLEIWINPTDVSSESQMTATALVHSAFASTYSNGTGVSTDELNLVLTASNMSGTTIKFDEFRLATTLAEVVPEPSCLGIVGCTTIGMLTRRRRRWML
jgi:hypothetical protein